jgi:hypothetical protein
VTIEGPPVLSLWSKGLPVELSKMRDTATSGVHSYFLHALREKRGPNFIGFSSLLGNLPPSNSFFLIIEQGHVSICVLCLLTWLTTMAAAAVIIAWSLNMMF